MKRLIPALLVAFALLLPAAPAWAQEGEAGPDSVESEDSMSATTDTSAAKENAQDAAEDWLSLVDAGEFSASYQDAANVFKGQLQEGDWTERGNQIQTQLGELKSRALVDARYMEEIPQAPEGEYVALRYDSEFSNGQMNELVILAQEGDGWKVAGYMVGPPQQQSMPDSDGSDGGSPEDGGGR